MTTLVSPDEAARRLGVSRRTVMRRLKQGTLTGQKHADRWLVDLANVPADVGNVPVTAHLAQLTQERDNLARQVDTLRAELSQAQDNGRALAAEVEQLRQLNIQLMGERDYLRQAHEAGLTLLGQLQQKALPAPGKRPWWRFWERDEEQSSLQG